MTPLSKLADHLQRAMPGVELNLSEPAAPDGVGFLDARHGGNVVAVQWQRDWHFGVSTPDGHGYGEKPHEIYRSAGEAAQRIAELLRSGKQTPPPREASPHEMGPAKSLA
jgi:hypothetical protein